MKKYTVQLNILILGYFESRINGAAFQGVYTVEDEEGHSENSQWQ